MKCTRCLIYNLHKIALTTIWTIQRSMKNNIQRDFLLDYLTFNKPNKYGDNCFQKYHL
jgi:hypothetical protein